MSLATRCPHCNTIFKVVQDQLKVSEGWVRCGRCQEVFNALEGLFDMEREPPPQRLSPPPAVDHPGTAGSQASPPSTPPPSRPATPATAEAPPRAPDPEPDLADDQDTHEGVTHFELDLPPSDEAVAAAVSAFTAPAAPSPDPALPVTDEADALDSRYLLPSDELRSAGRRRRPDRDFADAEFPSDAMADAVGWDTDWPPTDAASSLAASHDAPMVARGGVVAPLADQAGPAPDTRRPPDQADQDGDATIAARQPTAEDSPSTVPSRFHEADYQPERPLPPPSQRRGKPGTRGRPPTTEAPGFIKQAERKAVWRNPTVRGILSGLALALGLLLAGQVVHQERHRLASAHPALGPALTQWCQWAGCRIEPPLLLDALQVDSITLVRANSAGPDMYRLTAIIHNHEDLAVAWPRLDVTLTDPNGTVVVRRMLDVAQATVRGDNDVVGTLPAAVPAGSDTTLQWQLRAPGLQLAGYTVELFYP